MRALERKLLRDLGLIWSQGLTIALVVASGVAGFVTSFGAFDALVWSRDQYYADARFADVFATLKSAPLSLNRELQKIQGAAYVETSLTQMAPVSIEQVSDPIIGRLIGLSAREPQRLNKVQLRSGRMPQPYHATALEALVSEGFARARDLTIGDRLEALVNDKKEKLQLVGIALSPEYIFAGMAGSPDQRGFGVFWVDREFLAAAYNMTGAFNQVTVRLAPGATPELVINKLDRILRPYGGFHVHGRDLQISHMILESEMKEQRVLGTVLPSFFLLVAAFLLNVVLTRQITTQREQIAALKALGYDNRSIGLHYLKLMMAIVALGILLGLVLGAFMGHWFVGIYAEVFHFPKLHYRINPDAVLIAVAVTLSAGVMATFNAVRATIRLSPAAAMRPSSPGRYRPMLLERWGLQQWFSPAMRMIVRNMERRRMRTMLTIFGIAVAIAIVITGAFWRDSISVLMETQFQRVLRGDVSIGLIEVKPAPVVYEIGRLSHVTAVEAMRSIPARLTHANHSWRGNIQGKTAQPALHRIVAAQHISIAPPRDGLLLTDRLAQRLHVQAGDIVQVEFLEGRREVLQIPVAGLVTEMMGMNAYIERRALNALLREGNMINQLTLSVERGHEKELLHQLKQLPNVATAVSKSVMMQNITEVTARNILVFSAVLTAFATVIAVGVVYNSARIALAERAWELASLRVLGFTKSEVSAFLLGELAIEITLAIPIGMLFGYGLAYGIVGMIKTEESYFPFVITSATYAFAVLCVLAAGALSALVVRRRVDTLDLVSVLKTHE